MDAPAKDDALRILRDDHAEVRRLVDRLRPAAATRPGLGGGDWSPKDLLGHLTSWEQYALAAMGAWVDGRPAPIDLAIRSDGLNRVNRDAVEMKRDRPLRQILEEFEDIHEELHRALGAVPAQAWDAPPTTRAKRTLGRKVGGILGGPGGPFTHAAAHLPNLRAFVADPGAG
jgi:Mycothiol maleylpyruvate isomerase N-terminal domain